MLDKILKNNKSLMSNVSYLTVVINDLEVYKMKLEIFNQFNNVISYLKDNKKPITSTSPKSKTVIGALFLTGSLVVIIQVAVGVPEGSIISGNAI